MTLFAHPLVILCYHGITRDRSAHLNDFCFISDEKFGYDLQFIRNSGWHTVGLKDGLQMLKTGTLAKPSIALTFDDGFSETLRLAEPALAMHDVRATVFLPTRLVTERRVPWFGHVIRIISESRRDEINLYGHRLNISTRTSRAQASRFVQNFIKELHPKASDAVILKLAEAADVDANRIPQDYLTPDPSELQILALRGTFSFGAHSANHAIHSKMSFAEVGDEIRESVEFIRTLSGDKEVLYAYPNGRRSDFSARCMTDLIQSGASAAVTTVHGWNRQNTNPYSLKRYCVGQNTRIEDILRDPIERLQGMLPWQS